MSNFTCKKVKILELEQVFKAKSLFKRSVPFSRSWIPVNISYNLESHECNRTHSTSLSCASSQPRGHHYKFRPSYVHLRNVVKLLLCAYGSICRKTKKRGFKVEIMVPWLILKEGTG